MMHTTITRDIEPIGPDDLDSNLAAELEAPGAELYFAPEYAGDSRTGNGVQIAYCRWIGRAGLVYVGSGSSGVTAWTDCRSAGDALRRYLDDDMRA